MSNMIDAIISDDFVWSAIQPYIAGKTKTNARRETSINCPVCHLFGESKDTRHRCGIKKNPQGILIHCFNCGFKTRFEIGSAINKNLRLFLTNLGLPEKEVQQLNLKAMQYRRMIMSSDNALSLVPVPFVPNFLPASLPEGARTFLEWAEDGCTDTDFINTVQYLYSRGVDITEASTYYWTPNTKHSFNRRVIIPFYYKNKIVGWTGRIIDKTKEAKYFSHSPPDYLFNNQFIDSDRRFIILCEGPFDALAVGGVATLGAKLNANQTKWLKSSNKDIIIVPDRDSAGQRLIEKALENNWSVAFPKLKTGHGTNDWWDDDIKDLAQAVEKYGKIYATRSIIESATSAKTEITIKRSLLY